MAKQGQKSQGQKIKTSGKLSIFASLGALFARSQLDVFHSVLQVKLASKLSGLTQTY